MREMEDDGDVSEKLMRAAYSLFSFLFITSSFSISSKKKKRLAFPEVEVASPSKALALHSPL
jgi:hypothetical protein